MFDTLLFQCAICNREVRDWPNRSGRDKHLNPLCRGCEHRYSERTGRPRHGAMLDRRKAMQLLALADALHGEAASQKWNRQHGF